MSDATNKTKPAPGDARLHTLLLTEARKLFLVSCPPTSSLIRQAAANDLQVVHDCIPDLTLSHSYKLTHLFSAEWAVVLCLALSEPISEAEHTLGIARDTVRWRVLAQLLVHSNRLLHRRVYHVVDGRERVGRHVEFVLYLPSTGQSRRQPRRPERHEGKLRGRRRVFERVQTPRHVLVYFDTVRIEVDQADHEDVKT